MKTGLELTFQTIKLFHVMTVAEIFIFVYISCQALPQMQDNKTNNQTIWWKTDNLETLSKIEI